MIATAKLICPECQRENEAERIFCHDCGAKLDRSAVIASRPKDLREKERERVRKMFDPMRARIRFLFFKVCKLILGAFVTAAVVLLALPAEIPEVPKEPTALSQVGLELENAVTYHRVPTIQFTQDQVNYFLYQVSKTKKKALDKPLLDFKRAAVEFSEGKMKLATERSVFGYSLYAETSMAVQTADGKIKVSSNGGTIGRMPIHPQLMEYLDVVFADLWSALDRERKLVAKTNGVEFHDKLVVFSTAAP